MGETPTLRVELPSPWKFISQDLHSFSSLLSLHLGDGSHIKFSENILAGTTISKAFPSIFFA